MSKNNRSSGGISLAAAIFLIFLTLKLLGVEPVASWSWWWVTAPLWAGAALLIGVAMFGVGMIAIFSIFDRALSGRNVKIKDDE